MKLPYIALILFILLASVGCRSSQSVYTGNSLEFADNDFYTVGVPANIKDTSFNIENIFDSVSFIRLSNKKEAFVTAVDQVQFADSMLFVRDTYGTGTVKAFRMNGEYLHQMGRKGRGPGEYIEPTYMEVVGDMLAVYDQFNREIFFYDFSGKFVRSREFPFLFMKFHVFDDNNYLIHTISSDNNRDKTVLGYDLFFCDSLDNVTNRGFYRKKDTYENIINNHNFFAKNGVVYYHPIYNDTIYSLTADGTVKVEFAIDFGRKTVPERFRNGKNRSDLREEHEGTRYNFMKGDFFIADSVLAFSYTNAHRSRQCFYYPETGDLVSFGSRRGFFPLILFSLLESTDNAFVSALSPASVFGNVRNYRDKTPYEEIVKELGKERADLVMDMDINDNHIIVLYYPSKRPRL